MNATSEEPFPPGIDIATVGAVHKQRDTNRDSTWPVDARSYQGMEIRERITVAKDLEQTTLSCRSLILSVAFVCLLCYDHITRS